MGPGAEGWDQLLLTMATALMLSMRLPGEDPQESPYRGPTRNSLSTPRSPSSPTPENAEIPPTRALTWCSYTTPGWSPSRASPGSGVGGPAGILTRRRRRRRFSGVQSSSWHIHGPSLRSSSLTLCPSASPFLALSLFISDSPSTRPPSHPVPKLPPLTHLLPLPTYPSSPLQAPGGLGSLGAER